MVSHESDTRSLLVTSHHKNEQDNGKMDCVIFKSAWIVFPFCSITYDAINYVSVQMSIYIVSIF